MIARLEDLHEGVVRQEGGNPGSLIALVNILPEITEEAKKRY